jgi:hypothetical protein
MSATGRASHITRDPVRDPRLDFFRGLAMCIIFIAHLPGNSWAGFIPARFGPSDATEIFVFCSGFASAIAFGGTFLHHGFLLGTIRIAHRCWQVYWSHLGLFLVVATLSVLGTWRLGGTDYVAALHLQSFFAEPERGLAHLLALTYVPNYFDILPMYIVVLAMIPVVTALARIGTGAVAAFCLMLYLAQWRLDLDLPAEWWSDRPWFFNPLGWQLIFFTGFAFGSGWLPAPPRHRTVFWLALSWVVFLVPFNWHPMWSSLPWLDGPSRMLAPWQDKTHFGILRYLHFLALAYLALWIVNPRPHLLNGRVAGPIVAVGQQALPVFLWSMTCAQMLGMALDQLGRSGPTVAAANGLGLASLILMARFARLVRSQPWRPHAGRVATPSRTVTVATEWHEPVWARAAGA